MSDVSSRGACIAWLKEKPTPQSIYGRCFREVLRLCSTLPTQRNPSTGLAPRRRSTCATRRGEMLYVVPRPPPAPAQSRPTRSVCASWACSGLSSSRWPPRAWHPAGALHHRPDVHAPARRDALRAKTHPITPDMLGARVVGVRGSLIVAVGS
eukprot:scaffold69424_cov65-Phaeocystis_antarctica.AAC.2